MPAIDCVECKKPIPEGYKVCPSCGEEVDLLVGQSLLGGQYIIKRRIARGGFGVVYEASQPTVGGRAAIKVLRGHLSRKTDITARFQREAIVARKLSHPSAVKVYNLWKTDDGAHWIAMEFLEGETIEARLLRKLFTPEEMVGVLSVVCEVLQEAHQKGIVHRDLNTRNIMLMPTDSGLLPKVIDFGIADVSDASALLDSGMIMGTPSFMSPEQYRGLKFADERSDIYSLGMIAYRMISGKFPFNISGSDALAWMFQHTNEPPIPLAKIVAKPLPKGLEAAILKCLEKSPEKRYQSALAFKRDLEAALESRPAEAQIVSSVVRGPRRLEEVLPTNDDNQEDPFVGNEIDGYLLLKKIGEGTLGTVYQANELKTGKRVAFKICYRLGPMSDNTYQQLIKGPLPLAQLRHSAFAQLLAVGETDEGVLWVAEEYVEQAFDRTLAAAMTKQKLLPVETSARLLYQLCEAFDAAHGAGIWYHSLSPKKIVLTENGELNKILDIEVSGLLATAELIRSRMIQGDPAYTAPEQFKGVKLDQRADIYSLGVLAYQLLTGRLPFDIESDDVWNWMRAHCYESPRPISNTPWLWRVISQALEKEPSQRFASMNGFQIALREAFEKSRGEAQEPTVESTRNIGKDPSKKLPVETKEVIVSPIFKVGTVEAAIQEADKKRGEQRPEPPIEEPPATQPEPTKATEKEPEAAPPLDEERPPQPRPTPSFWWLGLLLAGVVLGAIAFFMLRTSDPCGNNQRDTGEACDDGNNTSGDGCSEDCKKLERCGDKIIDAGEACDDGNALNGDGCRNDCKGKEVCRDGLFDPISGEECDDGNQIDTDACSNDCHVKHCGNGKVEAPEECDGGPDCGPDCLKNPLPSCGNGAVDAAEEECDDGNANNNDACLRSCKRAKCGDDFLYEGVEQCDDGNKESNDACLPSCKKAKCGDSLVHKGVEECDDGNQIETDGCLQGCKLAACGDGFIQAGVEQCDDSNQNNNDACVGQCTPASCGDGFTQDGKEECDDGNGVDDACLNNCKKNQCGDGVLLAGVEECDDGNTNNTDSCVAQCKKPSCGDGFTQAGVEECDDANTSNNDACLQGCKKNQCGDGFLLQGAEECDDGNKNNADNCPLSCKPAFCGDGFVQESTEQCDDGNTNNDDGCVQGCKLATCGDGFVNFATEQCDDKNDANTDECSNNCKKARCGDGIVQTGVEECDDGNTSNSDDCHTDCRTPRCGDGITDAGEECDTNDTCDGPATCNGACACAQ